MEAVLSHGLAQASDPSLATKEGIGGLATWAMKAFGLAVAPILVVTVLAGILANVAQVRFNVTFKPLKPSFSRLNPLHGFKRLFGPSSLVETAKSLAKLAVIGGVLFFSTWPQLQGLGGLVGIPPGALLTKLAQMIMSIAVRAIAPLALIAAADYVIARRRHEKSLMMT